MEPHCDFMEENLNQYHLIKGDAKFQIEKLKNKSFDLIITSPPYNLGKEYENRATIEDYLKTQKSIISNLVNLLSDKGSICWEVGNYVNNGEVFPLDIYYYSIFKELGLKLRNRIIWHFGHGLHAKKRFSGRYESILWFSKKDQYIFNLDDVRVPSKYPGKKHFKGPNKGKLSGNPKGKNPSDIWNILQHDWDKEIWNIPNVKSNHPEKTEHPCQFPIELVERCILALSNENSWILDPFSGVGSTILAALKNKRNVVGIEKEEKYIKITQDRINSFIEGKLKYRPLTKPVYSPHKSKLAVYPEEWIKEAKK